MLNQAENNQKKIMDDLGAIQQWEERYKKIIQWGKELPTFPEEYRQEKFLVKGCQSQVWLHVSLNPQGQMEIVVDSDALIVKGLSAIVKKAYSGLKPQEVLNAPTEFIEKLGLKDHLSPSRANGFLAMIKQIQLYAQALSLLARS